MKKYLSILIIGLLFACSGENPQQKQASKQKVEVPTFNSDSAYHYIQTQVDFGPRFISSKGWDACGDYLFNELKKHTPYVQEQNTPFTTYDGKSHQLRNIIACLLYTSPSPRD